MERISRFKNQRRSERIQTSTERFDTGMVFSNRPLAEGFVKEIINYDIKEGGETLAPRPGLRAIDYNAHAGAVVYDAGLGLSYAKECVEEDNETYKQVILSDISNSKLTDTELYLGDGYVGLGTANTLTLEAMNTGGASVLFKKPSDREVHGVLVSELASMGKQVGVFAYNSDFYYFRSDGKLYRTYFDEATTSYKVTEVVPKAIDAKQAVLWGFNMLSQTPYTFANLHTAPRLILLGAAAYDASDSIVTQPLVNETVTLRAQYNKDGDASGDIEYNTNYRIKWEWKEYVNSDWTLIKEEDIDFTPEIVEGSPVYPEIETQFSSPATNVIIRLSVSELQETSPDGLEWAGPFEDFPDPEADYFATLYPNYPTLTPAFRHFWYNRDYILVDGAWVEMTTTLQEVPIQVLPIAMTFRKSSLGESAILGPVNYSLHTATGMAFWKRRLILYGVKEAKNIIFLSDPDDPEYFPYPNNIDIFDDPIIHVSALRESLLVFTTSAIHSVTLSPDGLSWTNILIQDKLNINPWDVHLIQNIKNMVYFRSGDYYYMIVPSLKREGDLAVAPISKNVEEFFDDFQNNVERAAKTLYDYQGSLTLVNYYNYLDFEDICNVYTYSTTSGVYLNFVLLYNTLRRSWRSYFYESQNSLISYKQDITKRGLLVSLFEFDSKPAVQFLEHTTGNPTDYYIPSGLTDMETAEATFETINVFKNYQFLDTGYLELDSDFKKRFREVQMKFYNASQEKLNFYTDFFIDGDLRRSMFKYFVNHNTDPLDADFGLITFEKELVDPVIVPGATVLGEGEGDTNLWELDVAQFPELSFWKVRFPVSGKGYAPRLRVISYNDQMYELLNLSWVFRPMYSR